MPRVSEAVGLRERMKRLFEIVIIGGCSTFVVTLISAALMKVFGQPLIDQLPAGDWGMDRLRDAGAWLVSPNSAFWFAAAATVLLIVWFVRRASVTWATTWNICLWLAAGILAGVVVTFTRLHAPANVWTDPAIWFLAAAYLMPLVTAVLWWTVPVVIDRLLARLQESSSSGHAIPAQSSGVKRSAEQPAPEPRS